jgi:hypothetical protein
VQKIKKSYNQSLFELFSSSGFRFARTFRTGRANGWIIRWWITRITRIAREGFILWGNVFFDGSNYISIKNFIFRAFISIICKSKVRFSFIKNLLILHGSRRSIHIRYFILTLISPVAVFKTTLALLHCDFTILPALHQDFLIK